MVNMKLALVPSSIVLSLTVISVTCQYNGGYSNGGYTAPKINILSHKQALSHDGSFNYAFSADNGLQQGEVINPDGSRQGSYSYVDPSGRTISLKYQAGKDGFRVLEGDHLPRAPPLPAGHQHAQHQHTQPAPYRAPYSAPAPAPAQYRHHQYNTDEGNDYEPQNYQYRSNNYDEEPSSSGPHTFGNGFSFEFGG